MEKIIQHPTEATAVRPPPMKPSDGPMLGGEVSFHLIGKGWSAGNWSDVQKETKVKPCFKTYQYP